MDPPMGKEGTVRNRWFPAVAILLAALASALAYGRLPDRVPTHWNLAGEPDDWGSRLFGVGLMPLVMLAVAVLVPVIPRLDPRRANYEKFWPTYMLVMNLVLAFMLFMHLLVISSMLGSGVRIERVMPFVLGVFLVVLGNVLPRTRSNWLFGIRTPWTLSSDRVWERTHRVGGYLMFGAGVLIIVASLLVPELAMYVVMGAVTVAALGSVVYSFAAWRQERES